jgi:hypothetical protein
MVMYPAQKHECWVRHGDPRQANLTVGSISMNKA